MVSRNAVEEQEMTPTTPSPGETILRIRVHLVDSEPEIWRLLEVDASLRLDQLHQVLQIAMGWENAHLHAFSEAPPYSASPSRKVPAVEPRRWMARELLEDDDRALAERDFTVAQVLSEEGGPLFYEYDFGDGWVHRIDLIETVAKMPVDPAARLIRGERRGPLEDSGGIDGYEELIRALADPAHEDHDDLTEWVGEDEFDPDELDTSGINRALTALFTPARKRRATRKKPPAQATPAPGATPPADREARDAFEAAGVRYEPGMAARMLREMAPLLAAEGIDLDQPSTFDTDTLNAALARATERSNLERFTPIGAARDDALALLRLVSEAISEGEDALAEAVIAGIESEPKAPGTASVAGVIGVGLGVLDEWHADAALTAALAGSRVPHWNKHARAAATDMLSLARKGRAFAAIGSLHQRYNGFVILEGTLLAVTAALVSRASQENRSVREIGIAALQ